MFKKYSKAKSVGAHRLHRYYWFTIQSPNGQTLATSETYTTAAMRDKGIEAVKKVVMTAVAKEAIVKGVRESYIRGADLLSNQVRKTREISNIQNKKGKIEKR